MHDPREMPYIQTARPGGGLGEKLLVELRFAPLDEDVHRVLEHVELVVRFVAEVLGVEDGLRGDNIQEYVVRGLIIRASDFGSSAGAPWRGS